MIDSAFPRMTCALVLASAWSIPASAQSRTDEIAKQQEAKAQAAASETPNRMEVFLEQNSTQRHGNPEYRPRRFYMRAWTTINPVVDVALDQAGILTFGNAAAEAEAATAPAGGYRARWMCSTMRAGIHGRSARLRPQRRAA